MHPRSCLLIALSALLSSTSGFSINSGGCTINIQRDLGDPQPLLLQPETTAATYEAFLLPTNGSNIHLTNRQQLTVACPGGKVKIQTTISNTDALNATCVSGRFSISNQSVQSSVSLPFAAITCSRHAFHTARFTNNTCLSSAMREIEIGFHQPHRFIRLLTLCFDPEAASTAYSAITLSKAIAGYQHSYPRPNFIEDKFYPFKVAPLYQRKKQRTTINLLVGLPATSTKYITSTGDLFLARGHLAAKADCITGAQQRATFHYVNAAPQWQTFNGRNWNNLEVNIRNYVARSASAATRFTLFSGTHGVTTLPHAETGEQIELYLYVKGDARGLPVPKLFWRVLRNEVTEEAVAFVGVNNPYHDDVDELEANGEIVCENVCEEITWLKWQHGVLDGSYSYCCHVDALRAVVGNVPEFKVSGLLVD